MVCGDIVKRQSHKQRSQRIKKSSHWLRSHKTKAFYSLMDNYFNNLKFNNLCYRALEMNVALAVLRVQEGLDYTGMIGDFDSMEDFSSGKLKSEGIDNP
ncbi:uncharacterized protein LOC124209967 [Daphnia pulex]|uniref:uncharacterized protein LOC124209967 n=1 Tax=Daphnia pulex TaxID=6669 RepID=UPI001EDEF664|nr:uncharacterized protein LOC124209967 [Daphnia pulex]